MFENEFVGIWYKFIIREIRVGRAGNKMIVPTFGPPLRSTTNMFPNGMLDTFDTGKLFRMTARLSVNANNFRRLATTQNTATATKNAHMPASITKVE